MDTYITGTIRNIFYKTDDGFVVGIFRIKDTNDNELIEYKNKTITFSGNFYNVREFDNYKFYGSINNHPKYGLQYKVKFYEELLPDSVDGMVSYLSSSIFPKVGVKTAKKIVDTLKDDTFDLILNDYTCLLKCGIKEPKARKIHDILEIEQTSYKTIIYLQEIGFSINESIKIYEKYKESTLNVINDNIYKIVSDINYITFNTVDKIALTINNDFNNINRIKACIIYSMKDLSFTSGSTYTTFNELYYKTLKNLNINIEEDEFKSYLVSLNKDKEIIILEDKYILKEMYDMEYFIASKLSSLNKIKKNTKGIESCLSMIEKEYDIKYNDLQKEAILSVFTNNVTIITGGPGTGKTTIINGIVNLYKEKNKLNEIGLSREIALTSPTGKSARRMSESTRFKACTIHSFLGWDKETDKCNLNEYNKSDVKLIIIDESSMIDVYLFSSLLKALNDDVSIVLVGDYNQLPSVREGFILKDLIDSNVIHTIKLTKLYRQNEDSYIVTLADNVNKGLLDDNFTDKRSDYNFIEVPKYNILDIVCKLVNKALEKGYDYNKVQVLVPMYKGINGIDNLNNKLQEIFNPKESTKDEFIYMDTIFREGDKVLLTKNINNLDITNGDIGIIDSITKLKNDVLVVINFDGIIVEFNKKNFEDLKLGYAISIHKSQGSEFDIVIMVVENSFKRMMYKKLIYTGITRAKKSLTIVGEKDSFTYAISNISNENRNTLLCDLIKGINN